MIRKTKLTFIKNAAFYWAAFLSLCFIFNCSTNADTDELRTRNLFSEYLGKSDIEVAGKLEDAFQQVFYGNENERLFHPAGDDMGYILDVASNDVRTEGMSYGMMVAVQLDKKEEFDRLWKWANTYMLHKEGNRAGYFAWQCSIDGNHIDPGSASDGEEWFAMSLYFAAGRWGNSEGIFNYQAEADKILHAMLHKHNTTDPIVTAMFDPEAKQIQFVPYEDWAEITDPSYHLPAFYELWARYASADNQFWKDAATASRQLFRNAAHPETGLMADYTDFQGTPHSLNGHEHFKSDAWRIMQNIGLDYSWWQKDHWQVEHSNRILSFFNSFEDFIPSEMTLDGKGLQPYTSEGLHSMAAVAALAADREHGERYVNYMWVNDVPRGQWRYYNGILYMLSLLQVSGEFKAYSP